MRQNVAKLRRAVGLGAAALLVATGAFAITAGPAHAIGTDWYVATDGDDSSGCTSTSDPCKTITEVVEDRAENNDIIHVAGGTYAEAEIGIDYNLTIEGAADGTTKVSEEGEGIFGVFGGDSVPTVTFKNLDISGNGKGDGVDAEFASINFIDSHVDGNAGYGVDAFEATIQATRSTFNGNGAGEDTGDGIFLDLGAVTADHSTFDGNDGYGIWVDSFNLEVADVQPDAVNGSDVSAALDHSTASNNGFAGVGGYDAVLQVLSSTLSGNSGAGIENDTGRATFGMAEVRNSTITGTKPWPVEDVPEITVAPPSGGILSISFEDNVAAKAHSAARAQVRTAHADVAKNAAALAPHIHALTSIGDLDPGEVAVSSSIVAKQATDVPDCALSTKAIVDDGYNVSSDADNSCGFSPDANDLSSTDPLLGPLADNGGPTQTHVLLKGSPAIDLVPEGQDGCAADATDQRDLARIQPVGGKCDAGAVELAADPLTIHPNSLPNGTVGVHYSTAVTATGGQYPTYLFALADGSLPPGLSLADDGAIGGTPTQAGTFTFTVSVNDPVLKSYTIVIAEPVAPGGAGAQPIANTGAHVLPTTALGVGAILAGLLMMFGAGLIGRRAGRHRLEA